MFHIIQPALRAPVDITICLSAS